jgi:hypothetical protein
MMDVRWLECGGEMVMIQNELFVEWYVRVGRFKSK